MVLFLFCRPDDGCQWPWVTWLANVMALSAKSPMVTSRPPLMGGGWAKSATSESSPTLAGGRRSATSRPGIGDGTRPGPLVLSF